MVYFQLRPEAFTEETQFILSRTKASLTGSREDRGLRARSPVVVPTVAESNAASHKSHTGMCGSGSHLKATSATTPSRWCPVTGNPVGRPSAQRALARRISPSGD